MPAPVLSPQLVRSVERRLAAATATTVSPFTGTVQAQDWGGRWWEYQLELGPFRGNDGRAAEAFFQALGGPATAFLFADPSLANTASVGTPLVAGASQAGGTLATDGWTPSTTVMRAGQCFSLGSDTNTRLYMVTEDAVSDGAGAATLSIVPELRVSPADNDPLEIADPEVLLRLAEPVPARVQPGALYRFAVTAREAI